MSTIIHIDIDALDKRLGHGNLWVKGWGDWQTDDQPTCLHGAIRHCQPIKGDAYIIEQVSKRYGFGTCHNDAADSWAHIKAKVVPDITDEMLADTFGPQWEPIVALVRRAAILTPDEAEQLAAAWAAARLAARLAAWDAARLAARDAARRTAVDAAGNAAGNAAWDAARLAAWDAARLAAWDAAGALVVRDLIGQHGFEQHHYDTLTRPWATVIGKVHPDDAEVQS